MLGEGPLWDHRQACLWWLDAMGKALFRLDPDTGDIQRIALPREAGCIGLSGTTGLIMADAGGFHLFDPASGVFDSLCDPDADRPDARMNDGKVAPGGGWFIAGSMDADIAGRAVGALYALAGDGEARTVATDIVCSNGPAFHENGRTAFHTDSASKRINAWAFDPQTGLYGPPQMHCDLSHYDGVPDGMVIDRDGMLWCAICGSGVIAGIDRAGRAVREIALPTPLVTSLAFGGPGLETLYVTSLSFPETATGEADGLLFAVTGHGLRGRAEPVFSPAGSAAGKASMQH